MVIAHPSEPRRSTGQVRAAVLDQPTPFNVGHVPAPFSWPGGVMIVAVAVRLPGRLVPAPAKE